MKFFGKYNYRKAYNNGYHSNTPVLLRRGKYQSPKRFKTYFGNRRINHHSTPIRNNYNESCKPLTPRTMIQDYKTRGLMGQPLTITIPDDNDDCVDEKNKKSFFKTIKNKFNKRNRAESETEDGEIQEVENNRENVPPVFDPNRKEINFTSEIKSVTGGVYEFTASKPLYPKMGTKSQSDGNIPIANGEEPPHKMRRQRSIGNCYVNQEFNTDSGILRPIVIDGSNVAFGHGKAKGKGLTFSSRGIDICVEYFKRRGHTNIVAFVPQFRLKNGQADHREILEKLERNGHLAFTPSRTLRNGRSFMSYDDRYIVQYAALHQGIIVSNDNYRDLVDESREMRFAIENRLLMFTFVGDTLMFPFDPLGKAGPNLENFLKFH